MKEIKGNNILYKSRTYYNGIISSITNLSNYKINFETYDIPNSLVVFPNNDIINANLYMSRFNNKNTKLDINNESNISFKFPNELEYSNYLTSVTTTEVQKEEVKWDSEFAFKVFDHINFYNFGHYPI